MMGVQLCEDAAEERITQFKWFNCMAWELYLSKALTKN